MPGFNRRQFNRYITHAGLTSLLGAGTLASAAPGSSNNASLMRLIVPFAPGGGGDVLGRLFADKLSIELDRNIIVENKPGGSTTIGTDFVVKSKPDGNTILLTIPLLIQTYYLFKKLPYDPFNDLLPIVDLVKSPLWIAVSTQRTAATNIAELIKDVKANPNQHMYGSIGNGSTSHILGNHLNKSAQLDMVHVPYKGSSQVTLALMAGEITSTILDLVTLGPMLSTGKIRLIGVTGLERTPLTPDVPTLKEQGFSGFELPTWAGFFAPKGTPVEIIKKLHDASIKVMNMPDVQPRLKDLGYVAGGLSTADFQKQLVLEKNRWASLIKDSGVEM
ncbi:tripartite tricarboxylate transporter substrate binding protein [Diaphorobacter ruginosibacter]|uniref:Tripartite tricarboxylate transporter substrate binding protein n=1 Tax=Diaphorobacter ruginosibacter TaxID=1715720 RepID=A0A7G9RU19_9BURK|nr:tripartite tricarboxylate transporter substrate binding protein [Diaphorobacter ruginosibacter]QNN59094.1 tripartite tricarboxylate transporter substrate binding protein [Diaphorobacter ruginosibacter]